ncbi:flagellar biosynthetic protein FliO [Leifsonia sp. A12D58]|uniref:flagellar biosynthetic protein FliO n=1 Tax=Leifsonia sp. A12D58 TaxID=3397674 RepID=UPI0039E04B85
MDTLVIALRVALSLAVVVGLLWFMQRRVTRSKRVSKNAQLIQVVGRQGVGQKASVVVVDIDGRRFVLGVTEQNVNVLQSAEAPVDVANEMSASADLFARSLDSATDELDAPVDAPADQAAFAAAPRALGGSILSPSTWKQTAAALRQHQ